MKTRFVMTIQRFLFLIDGGNVVCEIGFNKNKYEFNFFNVTA